MPRISTHPVEFGIVFHVTYHLQPDLRIPLYIPLFDKCDNFKIDNAIVKLAPVTEVVYFSFYLFYTPTHQGE